MVPANIFLGYIFEQNTLHFIPIYTVYTYIFFKLIIRFCCFLKPSADLWSPSSWTAHYVLCNMLCSVLGWFLKSVEKRRIRPKRVQSSSLYTNIGILARTRLLHGLRKCHGRLAKSSEDCAPSPDISQHALLLSVEGREKYLRKYSIISRWPQTTSDLLEEMNVELWLFFQEKLDRIESRTAQVFDLLCV